MLDVVRRLRDDAGSKADDALLRGGLEQLAGSPLLDITEYGCAVHAEMEALLCCARVGISPRGGSLYTTTFPCHNCAKHIIGAGIRRVIYIEPYAKSRAFDLHEDAIQHGPRRADRDTFGKVVFEPFFGVGPRRYFDLFSMTLGSGQPVKRKVAGEQVRWKASSAEPRIPLLPTSYLNREHMLNEDLSALLAELDTKRAS